MTSDKYSVNIILLILAGNYTRKCDKGLKGHTEKEILTFLRVSESNYPETHIKLLHLHDIRGKG